MKFKKEKCKYCDKDLESKTTRKEFCSSKCRVYWNRDQKVEASLPVKPIAPKPSKKEIAPPANLKGIDLAIWKAEQKAKK
jgi:tRNA(Ile2) C34 agmatinyltransferase TiaS